MSASDKMKMNLKNENCKGPQMEIKFCVEKTWYRKKGKGSKEGRKDLGLDCENEKEEGDEHIGLTEPQKVRHSNCASP